jgi:hypothetical protein
MKMQEAWDEEIFDSAMPTEVMREFSERDMANPLQDDSSVTADLCERFRLHGVVLGTLVDLDESNVPVVDFPTNSAGRHLQARSIITLSPKDVGREVALMFEAGDPLRPLVMGVIQHPDERLPAFPGVISSESQSPLEVQVDGERIVLTGKTEVVLRCGKASITLTRAGKVIIRGAYLLSRSSGVNRIKGGSVQIN